MATVLHPTRSQVHTNNWLDQYNQFVEKSEFTRIGWAATALMIQGCILSPAVLLTMAYYGGGDWQFLTSMLCFLLVIIPILSAQKLKYIFGGFYISLIAHVAMILINTLS
ncbi:hypothetical protein [Larkinella soli]|uniref:hypothetical protein n=1 Tax=Larkinella soli TaxID=1770527 RepID=UPI000FFB107E|nr:hypothetical protein [Larkinella soli]